MEKILKLFSIFLVLIISLQNLVSAPSEAAVIPSDGARNPIRRPKSTAAGGGSRSPNRVDPKRDCGGRGSRSECSQNTKCRWCRSDALDDTCFSKSEAWRLPPQVFSCEFWFQFFFFFLLSRCCVMMLTGMNYSLLRLIPFDSFVYFNTRILNIYEASRLRRE